MELGTSLAVRGRLAVSEALTIEGHVEGTIEVQDHTLTVGRGAKIEAQILARIATIGGTVHGTVTATEKVEILETGSLHGDIVAPRITIAEGAYVCGKVNMQPWNGDKVAVGESDPAMVTTR